MVFPGSARAGATKYDGNSQDKSGGDVQAALAGDTLPGSREVTADEIKEVVREVLAEQRQEPEVDKVVLKTIATLLTSFGIEESDRVELKADFVHLRKWRKSVDQATTVTFGVMVTTLVAGFLAALWVGIKVMLGK